MVAKDNNSCSNSNAAGPVGITMLPRESLRHSISHPPIHPLTNLLSTHVSAWKRITTIAVPEIGKPRQLQSSYHAVSSLCVGVKLVDRLLFPNPNYNLILADSYPGINKHRSTTSSLFHLCHKVTAGLNLQADTTSTSPLLCWSL